MNLGQHIRSGVKWLAVASMVGRFMQFAFGIALARILMPEDFGMIVTIQVFTGFVGMLASGGMGASLVRSKEANTRDFEAVFTMQLILGVLIYAGFFLLAPWIATYFKNPLYSDLIRVSAVSFLIRPFTSIRVAWLARQLAFKKQALVDVASGLLTGVVSVGMAVGGLGVWSLMISGLVGALFSNVLLWGATPLKANLRFDVDVARRHSAYGLQATASELLSYSIEQSVNLIISRSAGASMVGLYNKAESLARMPSQLITPPTGRTVFRALATVQDNLDQTKYILYRTITLLMVYVFPALIGLWWIAEPFVDVVYGHKWLPIVEPMRVMILYGFCRTITTPCGVLLAARNRLRDQLIMQLFGFATTVVACLIGSRWGLQGVAWATTITGTIFAVYAYVLAYRLIPTRAMDLLNAAMPALILNSCLFVALAVTHFLLAEMGEQVQWRYLVAMIAVGFITYASALLFLPIPALHTEAARWRGIAMKALTFVRKLRR